MDGLGYACALLLAGVFVRAGAAKLARPATTAAGFAALGVPVAARAARAVPLVELLCAVALIGAPRAGGGAGLVLLAGLSVVLVRALRAGWAVPCNCFGTARAEPVSTTDLVRNALLAGLAAVSLADTHPTVPGPMAVVVAVGAFAAGLVALATLRRRSRPGHAQAGTP
ncbi:MAG TPA: MauE/DoxX family redox-associated membrane protein [Acidimicrobiales bacterium]|nr:MauE/DoxX family redox-associated membrane protein [Acidimicrobiales bacterium]